MIYEFAATQDLHGYAAPWAPGAGENQLPRMVAGTYTGKGITAIVDNDGVATLSGTSDSAGNAIIIPLKEAITVPAGTAFYIQCHNTATLPALSPTFEDDNFHTYAAGALATANRIYQASAPESDIVVLQVRFYIGANVTISGKFAPMFTVDSTPVDYTPYSNICPPVGFNIWDPSNAEYIQVYAGYVNANTRELYLRPVYEEYAGEELVGPWMSSLDEYLEDATPTEGAFVIDFGGELTSYEITPFMLQTLLDSLGIRQHFTNGAGLLNSLMDQAQGRVRSEEELLHLSRPLNVIAIGDQLPAGLTFKPISKDVLPGLPGKFIR